MDEDGHVSIVSVIEDRIEWPGVAEAALKESKKLWILSGPSIIVVIFNFLLSAVSQMFAGHLGESELAGASIANIGIQGFAYGVLIGMASAVQTVCGQAFGAKQYSILGLICQRSMMKVQEERHANPMLRGEKERLEMENRSLKEAMTNRSCYNSGAPGMLTEIPFEEQQMRLEITRLKNEFTTADVSMAEPVHQMEREPYEVPYSQDRAQTETQTLDPPFDGHELQ